jgi:hypothetical protein
MKHPVNHLRFPESTVEAVTEFRQVTGQVLWTDAMMHTTNIALDIGDQGIMVLWIPLPEYKPGKFPFF